MLEKQNLLISFIIPVYNVERYLKRCVNSVIEQIYRNIEIILIDDGSTDQSGFICDELAAQDSRIKVIHKKNGGLSSARNAGIRLAKGDYLCFVDSDDWVDIDLIEKLLSILDPKKDDVFVYGLRMVDEWSARSGGEISAATMTGEEALASFVCNKINGYAWNKLVRRKLMLDNNILYPEGRNYEDIPTTYKLFIHAKQVKLTEHVFYNYYINNMDSITSKDSYRNLQDFYLSCNDMYEGVLEFYELNHIDTTQLRCFRINLYTQMYIRIMYYLRHGTIIDGKEETEKLLYNVKQVLDNEKVPLKKMKEFVNFKKYMLYKLHLIKFVIRWNLRRARGYQKTNI